MVRSVAERVFGHVPGVVVGQTFSNRKAVYDAGVHRQLQAGICGGPDGTESIVVSGGYVDDQDLGDVIVYTGQGGRDANSGRQVADQELTRGNLGLVRSHLDGLPVRVARGFEGDAAYSPAAGYRYDGLFRVDEYWQEAGVHGFKIWRFRLVAVAADESTGADGSGGVDTAQSSTTDSPGRAQTTIQRIIRSTKVAEKVKQLHAYTCQVCGTSVETPAGPYAEAAHIHALGTPHHGPDIAENLLCLCPNDHVRFDTGAIYIDEAFRVRLTTGDKVLSRLRLKPGHQPGRDYVAYHRVHFAGKDL